MPAWHVQVHVLEVNEPSEGLVGCSLRTVCLQHPDAGCFLLSSHCCALQTPVEVPMAVPVPTPVLVPTPFDIQVPQMVGVLPLS